MSDTPDSGRRPPGDPDVLPPSAVRVELERIVASDAFRRSPRHRSFLRFVVEHKLVGQVGRLKEIVLAVAVFGRPQGRFDPQRDPIVRVEAGRLREKLARFYETEGGDSTVEIGIPKGGYVPTFARRSPTPAAGPCTTSIAVRCATR